MTRIKFCGITSGDDMRAAVRCGCDAIGAIAVPGSARSVLERDVSWLEAVPPLVARVAVCRSPREVPEGLLERVDAVQFYEAAGLDGLRPGLRRIRALRVTGRPTPGELAAAVEGVDALLLDAWAPHALGGTGVRLDWRVAREVVEALSLPVMLAGGLSPGNVAEAVRAVRPYAVDVASGVEAAPGRKDHESLLQFARAVRAADRDGESR
ncbi:MAG: phosphoribosylanthranilate isomerase [Chthonomonadales bacterium]|nr:phosphoribosylanthranilate isomerase [Chthonomonadales bacterium]